MKHQVVVHMRTDGPVCILLGDQSQQQFVVTNMTNEQIGDMGGEDGAIFMATLAGRHAELAEYVRPARYSAEVY